MADTTNPLFDGNLTVTIGGQNVTSALLPGLSWSNTMPGGFGDATMRLPASSPWGTYHASIVKGAAVSITHSGTTLFEGKVTNDLSHATIENGEAFYDITAAGLWWVAQQKKDFCAVFTDDDHGQWFVSPSANKQLQADTEGRLYIGLEKGSPVKANSAASIFYWLHGGLGSGNDEIKYFCAALNYDVSATNWYFDVSTSPTTPWGTWTVQQQWTNASASAGFTIIACPAGTQALRARAYSSLDVTAVTDTRFAELTDVCVVGSSSAGYWTGCSMTSANPTTITTGSAHGLKVGDRVACMRSGGATGPHGWYTVNTVPSSTTFTISVLGSSSYTLTVCRGTRISQAMTDIAGDDTTLTTSLATTGDSPTFGALHYGLNVRPYTTRADAIDSLAMLYSAPIDYAFWESTDCWQCTERATPSSSNDYLVDATTPGVDWDVFKEQEGSPAYVRVLFKSRGHATIPDGYVCSLTRPSTPDWDTATYVVDVWDQWADVSMTEAQAQDLADQILDWIDNNVYVGTCRIATPTVPIRSGGTKNAAYIRAGNYIFETNHQTQLGGTQRQMITSVQVDVDSGVVTLGIGESRREFVRRIRPRRWSGEGMAGEVMNEDGTYSSA